MTQPVPDADASIVRHVLFLDGPGRPTPYHSTTESRVTAQFFAGSDGKVYETHIVDILASGARHISHIELMNLLRGKGYGDAKWHSAAEVLQARRRVEQHVEHLLDFATLNSLSRAKLRELVNNLYR